MRKRELEDLLMKAVADALGVEAAESADQSLKATKTADRRSRTEERVAA